MLKVKSEAFFYKAVSLHKFCLNLIGKEELFHGLFSSMICIKAIMKHLKNTHITFNQIEVFRGCVGIFVISPGRC